MLYEKVWGIVWCGWVGEDRLEGPGAWPRSPTMPRPARFKTDMTFPRASGGVGPRTTFFFFFPSQLDHVLLGFERMTVAVEAERVDSTASK